MLVYIIAALTESRKQPIPLEGIREGSSWKAVYWSIIGIGLFLRLFHFFDNRSLFIDEIFLASSLIKMNFMELAAPALDYEQKAPIGFLWLVHVCTLLIGKNELGMRLFPLLCGVASLFIFLPVARYLLKPVGVVIALGILALAPPLVYHAVEIKQYSTELLATVVALYLFIQYHKKQDIRSLLLWGTFGAIIIWFSFSSIFILAGIAIGSSLYFLLKKDWPTLFRSLIPFSMWLVSFAVNYLFFTSRHAESEWLVFWFKNHEAFMPLPPTALADLKWFIQTPYKVMHYPMGLLWFSPTINLHTLVRILVRMTPMFLLVLGVGMFVFYRQNKKLFIIMVFPVVLHLLASGLEIYPFFDRLVVYLAPLLILFIARGGEYITNLFPPRAKWRYLVPALLLIGPLANSAIQVANPALFGDYKKSYQREALLYINQRFQPGDAVYIYWNGMPSYQVYKQLYDLKYEVIEGRDIKKVSRDMNDYINNLSTGFNAFAGKKRVWYLYNKQHNVNMGDIYGKPEWYYKTPGEPTKLLHHKFSALGKEVDNFDAPDVHVSLFQLPAN